MPVSIVVHRRLRNGSVYTGTAPNVADFTDRAGSTLTVTGARASFWTEWSVPGGTLNWPASVDRGPGFRIQVHITPPSRYPGHVLAYAHNGVDITLSSGARLTLGNNFVRIADGLWVLENPIDTSTITGATLASNAQIEFSRRPGPAINATTIANRTATPSGGAQTLDIANHFSSTVSSGLSYFANDTSATVVATSLSGTRLTMTPGSTAGVATVRVAARGASFGARAAGIIDFTFTVAAAPVVTNPAPTTVGSISNRTANTSGNAQTLNVASFFADTDTLTYSATSSNTGVVAVSVSGSTLTMTPGSTAGTATVAVTATDTAAQSIQQTFSFTTSAPNPRPTRVGTIANRTVNVSSTAFTVNLASFFADTDALAYAATSSSTGIAAVAAVGSVLTVTPGNVAGTATITATATDTASQSISQTFTVTTTQNAQNPAPTTVGTMSNIVAQVSTGAQQRDVASFFRDTDALTYAATTSNSDLVAVAVAGSTLTMTPGASAGVATITVTATDTGSQRATQTFTFTTTTAPPVNTPPTAVGTISNRTAQTGSAAQTLNVAAHFRDFDTLTYAATSSNTAAVAVTMRGSVLTMTPGSTVGTSTITVTATDTASQSVNQTFTFTLSAAPPPNPPPTTVGTPPDRAWQIGTGDQRIAMAAYFSDANDTLTYAATSSATGRVTGEIHSLTGMLTLELVAVGSATITVTATDTAGQAVAQAFLVTITAGAPPGQITVPRMTIIEPIPDQTMAQGETRTLALRDFINYDGDDFDWATVGVSEDNVLSRAEVVTDAGFSFYIEDYDSVEDLSLLLEAYDDPYNPFEERHGEVRLAFFIAPPEAPLQEVIVTFNVTVEAKVNHVVRVIPDRQQRMSDGAHTYMAGDFFSDIT